jgi:L-alanine-DL-glutamate epimerase-like enolase superfamily enzyme
VSCIEIALWDLVGRVYGAPCYQFLGGKYRDRVRLYADTPSPKENTPEGYAERIRHRKALGLTLIKFDMMLHRLVAADENVTLGEPSPHDYRLARRFAARGEVGTQLSEQGLELMEEIISACREAAGPDIPLALDHFGPLTVKDGIRMGRALEGYGIAWLEDIMPVWDVEGNREVTRAIEVPTLNGEQGYLLKGLREMIDTRAVDILQPDLVTVGGMAELKRVADYADEQDIPTVLHCAGSPVMFMANIHCAAAVQSLVAQEIHSLDIPFWKDLVTGLPEPFMEDGYVRVPEKPGLGVELNEEVIQEHIRYGGYFEPTEEWNSPKLGWWIPPEQRE